MDLDGFASPWEHIRLLSDATRNSAMITLLERRAPGARVVEVGCGTGLLSCIAARMGAKKVYAIEPTALVTEAEQIVRDNGLSDIVEVITGRVQDVEPRPVDLAFSELLNADPFYEGVLDAMDAVQPWVVEGGIAAPRRLKVWVALARASGSAREVRSARREVKRYGDTYDLDLRHLIDLLEVRESYRYHTLTEEPASEPVLAFDLALGTGERPPERSRIEVSIDEPGPVGGAMVWFEAEVDDGIVLENPPGGGDHWGQLVCAWADEVGTVAGGRFALEVRIDDDEIDVVPVL